MDNNISNPSSQISDHWLNACYYCPNYPIRDIVQILISWSEPQFLITCCYFFLLILPIIFLIRKNDSYNKSSRLYNLSRLSILTFTHRIFYIFILIWPISFIIKQHPPCSVKYNSETVHFGFYKDFNNYNLPSTWFCGINFSVLFFASFSLASKHKLSFLFYIFLLLITIHFVFAGNLSLAQASVTPCIVYILHFYSMRVPFFSIFIEDALLAAFFVSFCLINRNSFFTTSNATDKGNLSHVIMTLTIWIIDVFIFLRYSLTRANLINIRKPIDMEIESELNSKSFFIANEAEGEIFKNLKNDFFDSLITVCILFIGFVCQRVVFYQ